MERGPRLPKIGFLGSMNAMPMAYALKFKRDGYDVKYVVEADRDNHLMRPEFHYDKAIPYPYPDWIVEIPWRNDLVRHAMAPWTHRAGVAAMADRDIVFLNDSSISLASRMPPGAVCVALSSGSDIDIFGRWPMAWALSARIRRRWLYPARLVMELARVGFQRRGLKRCDLICYFPRGLNPRGDQVVDALAAQGRRPAVVERYDSNFEALGLKKVPVVSGRRMMKILVPVRFNMNPPPGTEFEYKGNDIILRGLARYRQRNPNIQIGLIDKGPPSELAAARELCTSLGLDDIVVWHQPMPLTDLLDLYADADVIFDQVGHHWMGAIGAYALYMGRPLVANARLDIFGRLWGGDVPILDARNEDDIVKQLTRCEDPTERARIGEEGHEFARRHLDTEAVYQQLRDAATELSHRQSGRGLVA